MELFRGILFIALRKLSDTGSTVDAQFRKGHHKISQWADLVTVHSVSGSGVIQGLKAVCFPVVIATIQNFVKRNEIFLGL